jgi:hypothetical protein
MLRKLRCILFLDGMVGVRSTLVEMHDGMGWDLFYTS